MFSKIRELSKNTTIYGLGDVAVSLVNFGLWGLYVKYFNLLDYGVINLLLSVEVVAKVLFRFGLDGAFMRLYHDTDRPEERQRLASTIVLFLLAVDGTALAVMLIASSPIAAWLLGNARQALPLRLMLVNTFAIAFTFVPFMMLQIEQRATLFSAVTLLRSVLTIVLRLLLVIRFGMGIPGLYLADLLVTALTLAILAPWFVKMLRPMFSRQVLREALAFGLPRLPHAGAQQVLAVGDKFVLAQFVSIDNIGVYGTAVTFGLAQKLFLSAFQSAWAPFIFATAREPDAKRVFRTVTTYGLAILALLTAAVSAVGSDAIAAMTHGRLLGLHDPRWLDVASVVSWTAVGVFLQGAYLLTSTGLNITKKTQYYPLATMTAAAVNIGLNFLLVRHWGIIGAAWANAAGYATQAALAFAFSQRFYRVDYEYGRIARLVAAAIVAYAAARLLPHIGLPVDPRSSLARLPDVVARGLTVVGVFTVLLGATGFFHAEELRWLRAVRRRTPTSRPTLRPAPDSTEMAGEIAATDIETPDRQMDPDSR